jgi:hypothetical protein
MAAFAIDRIRASGVLRACALLAFVEYGALLFLAVLGERFRPDLWHDGTSFQMAGWLALCSLGSWCSLFAWFPFLHRLHDAEDADVAAGDAAGVAGRTGRILEALAIGCVAFVHGMLAWILVLAVR